MPWCFHWKTRWPPTRNWRIGKMVTCSRQQAQHFLKEINKCRKSPGYFLDTYCQIYDATAGDWVPFRLWSAQRGIVESITANRLVVILKARQLGLTWLVLGF